MDTRCSIEVSVFGASYNSSLLPSLPLTLPPSLYPYTQLKLCSQPPSLSPSFPPQDLEDLKELVEPDRARPSPSSSFPSSPSSFLPSSLHPFSGERERIQIVRTTDPLTLHVYFFSPSPPPPSLAAAFPSSLSTSPSRLLLSGRHHSSVTAPLPPLPPRLLDLAAAAAAPAASSCPGPSAFIVKIPRFYPHHVKKEGGGLQGGREEGREGYRG